jgi:hypothetical protein
MVGKRKNGSKRYAQGDPKRRKRLGQSGPLLERLFGFPRKRGISKVLISQEEGTK